MVMAEIKRDGRGPLGCLGDGPQPSAAGAEPRARGARTSELLRQIERCEDELNVGVAAGELFEAAINAIGQGIVIFDEQSLRIKYANEAARSAIGDIENHYNIKRGTLLLQPIDVLASLLNVQTTAPDFALAAGWAAEAAKPPLVVRALTDRQGIRRGLILCWSAAKPERPLLM